MRRDIAGFTLVELVVVIVLLGILIAYAAPRFAGRSVYSELTAQQDLIQSIRFAQQLAMSRTSTSITLVTNSSQIDVRDSGSSQSRSGYPKDLPKDVSLNNLSLTFDRLGSAGTTRTTINISGTAQTLRVCVEGTTGYAHAC